MGTFASRNCSSLVSVAFSAPEISAEISLCISNRLTALSCRSYVLAQICSSVDASMSWALILTLSPIRCTAPSRIVPTPSSSAICRRFLVVSRYSIIDVREITFNAAMFARRVSKSSWMPSANNWLSGSVLRLVKGRTAIDERSTTASGATSTFRRPVTFKVTDMASAIASNGMMKKSSLRPVFGVIDAERSTFFSSLTPSGVSSKTQARTRDARKPTRTMIT